ncbi:class I SAM-dependent methyltransferase [bacterium]|nr:class I SAM-dependent methyltransferase [bacterium]
MENLKETILKSLDGDNIDLLPYIPYLLQDLWEIGSSAKAIIGIIKKHNLYKQDTTSKILDLACGKGAVSISLAKEFGFSVHGIDAVSDFIEEARNKAKEWNVEKLCEFQIGDIRESVHALREYDIIILGSIGPVLGNIEETLQQLKTCILPAGYIILDDAFIPIGSDFNHPDYLSENEFMAQINRSNFQIIGSSFINESDISEYDDMYRHIETRAKELMALYPAKKYLFEEYLKSQRVENEILKNRVKCVTLLLKGK